MNNKADIIDSEVSNKIDIRKKILIDRVKILNSNLLINQIANFVCATVVFVAFYQVMNPNLVWSWYGAVIFVTLTRFIFWFFYQRQPASSELHLFLFVLGAALSASLWGAANSFLMPDNRLLVQMIVIVITAGLTSGGIQTLQASLTACVIYVTLIIFPLTSWLFLQSGIAYKVLGITLATYLLFMISIAVRNHRLLTKSLALHYQNYELIEILSFSNKQLQQREHDINFINKMNDMLQTCHDSKEAYEIIQKAATELFDGLSGGLCIFNQTNNTLETMKEWGAKKILKNTFSFNDCWALRENRIYRIEDEKSLSCNHFQTMSENYLCVPLILPSGIIGLLNFHALKNNKISDYQIELAYSFSEVVKLSLANIKLQEKLQEQTIHDPLTGLFNRRYLAETLPRELKRVIREKSVLCVSMMDLDNFKDFNNVYGHEAGDEVLKFIGNKLDELFRGSDIACRFGGEEFIIILNNINLDSAVIRMQRFCKAIHQAQIHFQGQLLPAINVSIGIAEAPRQGQTMEKIIQMADEALYLAKNHGKGRVEVINRISSTSE